MAMDKCRSLYVHIPFCRSKCAYCDFNSYARQERLIPAYIDAVLHEASLWAETVVVDRLDTLYVGGGTPSLLPIAETRRLIDGLRERFNIATDAEITIETNPESAAPDHLAALRRLGINRLSLGVQSFDDADLHFLGRIHDAAQAETAYRAARDGAFESVNIDLIFGLPAQTLPQWQASLEKALTLSPNHLSLYSLTIEDGTPLVRSIGAGRCAEPDPDVQADMYSWSSQRLTAAGYDHYEISNWARPGHECKHNLTYWHCAPYLGLGAGAHSYLDGYRLANRRRPDKYIKLVSACSQAWPGAKMAHVEAIEEPNSERELSDAVIMGLRLVRGVSLNAMGERFGVDLHQRFRLAIHETEALGLLESVDGQIKLTERGRLLGNEVFRRFLS